MDLNSAIYCQIVNFKLGYKIFVIQRYSIEKLFIIKTEQEEEAESKFFKNQNTYLVL